MPLFIAGSEVTTHARAPGAGDCHVASLLAMAGGGGAAGGGATGGGGRRDLAVVSICIWHQSVAADRIVQMWHRFASLQRLQRGGDRSRAGTARGVAGQVRRY